MAQSPKRGIKADIKGPLIMAVVLAVVAFLGVLVFATGGTDNAPQINLALIVAGGVFVVTLVTCATLIIVERPNDEDLGQGTGVNRRSADLYAEARKRRDAREKAAREAAERETASGSDASSGEQASDARRPGSSSAASDEARYGQRARPEDHN